MLEHRTIRGIDIAFEWVDAGGELIVFLHGVGADRTSWAPQLPFFSQLGYSVAALDIRGTGASQARYETGIAIPISIQDFAADVNTLILDLGFQHAHWVGNSMGGVVIMQAMKEKYSTIANAVLCNTFAKHPSSDILLPRPGQALRSKSLEQFAADRIPAAHRPDIDRETLQASIASMAAKDVETYLLSWRETWRHDFRDALRSVTTPSLVITGSLDKITPPALGMEIAHLIPNAKYCQIDNAGHLSNLDQPQEFNRVVFEFLRNGS